MRAFALNSYSYNNTKTVARHKTHNPFKITQNHKKDPWPNCARQQAFNLKIEGSSPSGSVDYTTQGQMAKSGFQGVRLLTGRFS